MKRLSRIVLSLGLSAGLLAGAALPASANGGGSCTLNGKVVKFTIHESPGEGDVSYINFDSPVELATDGRSYATIYKEIDAAAIYSRGLASYPIDGDGYWNYRSVFNWDGVSAYSYVERVYMRAVAKSNGAVCGTNDYI